MSYVRARSEQRLVSVAKRRIRQQQAFLTERPFREAFRAEAIEQLFGLRPELRFGSSGPHPVFR
jgi:hypothetical protein